MAVVEGLRVSCTGNRINRGSCEWPQRSGMRGQRFSTHVIWRFKEKRHACAIGFGSTARPTHFPKPRHEAGCQHSEEARRLRSAATGRRKVIWWTTSGKPGNGGRLQLGGPAAVTAPANCPAVPAGRATLPSKRGGSNEASPSEDLRPDMLPAKSGQTPLLDRDAKPKTTGSRNRSPRDSRGAAWRRPRGRSAGRQ